MVTTVIEQITEFLETFGDHTNTYMIEAPTVTGGVLELSGAVAGYWNNTNDELTGSPLIAGWILCMENRKMLRIVQTTNKKSVSIKLTKKR